MTRLTSTGLAQSEPCPVPWTGAECKWHCSPMTSLWLALKNALKSTLVLRLSPGYLNYLLCCGVSHTLYPATPPGLHRLSAAPGTGTGRGN